MDLKTSVPQVSKSYKMYARRLEKLGIAKLEDFLYHIPFRYDNYSVISDINKLQQGEVVTVKGKVEKFENVYTRRFKTFQKAIISDKTGFLNLLWFNQPFLSKVIKEGESISVSGKVTLDKGKLTIVAPEYEIVFQNETLHTGRLVPVYSETKGISSKWLRRQVFNLLKDISQIEEFLPENIIKKNNLISLQDAIEKIHFPDNLEQAQKARERLAFDELFEIQLSTLLRKSQWKKEKILPMKIDRKKIEKFIKSLPFELTPSQIDTTEQILNDLSSQTPMNRLLEGDVGSGKTIVAAITMYVAFLNGYESALMAPTEILANQHFKTVGNFLSKFGVKVGLLTGSTKNDKEGFDILIGTHALIHKKSFKKLKLVIIDEQQHFGVEQRGKLKSKGENPHLLTMTATPIPRTVALTLYGDLDLSILTDMPKGRIPIKTWLVPPEKRKNAYDWIAKKVSQGDQIFIICPFIEESETMATVKAATKEFEVLQKQIFPKLTLGLLHGKLKSKEKENILSDFRKGKIDILVSTPVVEVGIDIPNATIMLIEEADRFGLAQLHQLRGRVGRGEKESFCLLFTSSKNPQTLERLRSLEKIYSGAILSEIDLKLRGAGQIYGTAQHGVIGLKIASFSDFELLEKTKKEAQEILSKISKYPSILKRAEDINKTKVSPD